MPESMRRASCGDAKGGSGRALAGDEGMPALRRACMLCQWWAAALLIVAHTSNFYVPLFGSHWEPATAEALQRAVYQD